MTDDKALHWELLHSEPPPTGGPSLAAFRAEVPGGWIYLLTSSSGKTAVYVPRPPPGARVE